MKKRVCFGVLAALFLFIGCATTGQFKKNEKVKLILQDGHKIKCYVTHVNRAQIFFQATNSRDAYNYGDFISNGQVRAVRLSDNTEMSVDDYRKYRKTLKMMAAGAKAGTQQNYVFDPIYEKLKYKDIDDMTEKEFQYFLMMKEQENILRQRDIDLTAKNKHLSEVQKMNSRLEQLYSRQQAIPRPPQVVPDVTPQVLPPQGLTKPPVKMEPRKLIQPGTPAVPIQNYAGIVNLVDETSLTAILLRRVRERQNQGFQLDDSQQKFIKSLVESPKWLQFKEKIQTLQQDAQKAMEQVFLLQPEALRDKLELDFNPNQAMDFEALTTQLAHSMRAPISISDYRKLVAVFGAKDALVIKNLLNHFEDWLFIQHHKNYSNR